MSTNSKEYQAKYMRPMRVVNSLQKHVKTLHKIVKEYAETLQESVKKPLQELVKECIEPLQESVKTLQESVKKPLQELVKENGEIGSKTAFLGENCKANIGGKGGFGGVSLNNVTLKSVTDNDVTSTIYLKEKNTKKRKEKKANYSPEFESVYKAYPNKSKKFKCWEYWQSFAKDGALPTPAELIACINVQKNSFAWEKEDGAYIPMDSTWFCNRMWEAVMDKSPNAVKKQIEAILGQNMAKPVQNPNGHKTAQKEPTEDRILKGVKLPTHSEWIKMPGYEMSRLSAELNFSIREIGLEITKRELQTSRRHNEQ
jgi:hypothetical protein